MINFNKTHFVSSDKRAEHIPPEYCTSVPFVTIVIIDAPPSTAKNTLARILEGQKKHGRYARSQN